MKYFTPQWWDLQVDDPQAVVQDYWRYIESIRPRLTPCLTALLDDVSLHDATLQEASEDAGRQTLTLVLDGFVDPWTPPATDRRRITLTYRGVSAVELVKSRGKPAAADARKLAASMASHEIGYHELELLPDGRFEHRMLLSCGQGKTLEAAIRFADLQLDDAP